MPKRVKKNCTTVNACTDLIPLKPTQKSMPKPYRQINFDLIPSKFSAVVIYLGSFCVRLKCAILIDHNYFVLFLLLHYVCNIEHSHDYFKTLICPNDYAASNRNYSKLPHETMHLRLPSF